MKIRIISVGKIRQDWVRQGLAMYLERLGPDVRIRENIVHDSNVHDEGVAILKLMDHDHHTMALSPEGKQTDSLTMCELFRDPATTVTFIIGGPDGLADSVKKECDGIISLSRLTFPHELARLLLMEQIYRCWTIRAGRRYHR